MNQTSKSLIIVFLVFLSCTNDSKKRDAEIIIKKIYHFEHMNGRLPKSLNEVGIKESESGPFYYRISEDSSNFIFWFGLSLGESLTYNSINNEWK